MSMFTSGSAAGGTINDPSYISSTPAVPARFVYKLLMRTSGPQSASGEDYDMDTDSDQTVSVFEYQVPASYTFKLWRVNFEIVGTGMRMLYFGNTTGPLTNGCLFQIMDSDGATELLDFTNGLTIASNADFALLAGVDSIIQPAAGEDIMPVRFTVAKAGAPMLLTAGQRIRWTVRDDISSNAVFRTMVQGTISPA